ncbi:carbonic anhydrase, partial [Choiromyces venosus 120613-1]
VTCMDARFHPTSAFALGLGRTHIVRNAGGSAEDALRSIIISQQRLGTNELVLIKHTGCGTMTFTDEDIGRDLGRKCDMSFRTLPAGRLEEEVRRDVEFLWMLRGILVGGWVYD